MMNGGQLFLVSGIFLVMGLPKTHATASNSLADCQAIAAQFRTTINTTASNITATTGVNVTCAATSVVCPGRNISGVCVWQRKLSAVCRTVGGVVKIRIQTNGLPPRCASVPMGTFAELNIDFEVNFNPDVSINSLNKNLTTVSSLSQTICTLTYSNTVPSASGFVNYGGTGLSTVTGVSVDGVALYSSDSADNVDPFFPPAGGVVESVDSCLAHCQAAGAYHYHMATGCMVNPPTGTITSCMGTPACQSNIATYSISSFSSYQTMTVIGIAKDGHVVYGPYLSANTRVTSGFDVCNGMFYDSIGNYAYFATSTYPYMVGCFGPGNYPSFGPNCTTNGVSSYNMSSYAIALLNGSNNSTTASSSSTMSSSSSTVLSSNSTISSNSSSASSSSSSSTASTSASVTAARLPSISVRLCINNILLLFGIIIVMF